MQSPLSLKSVMAILVQEVRSDFVWQILDENHQFYGALFSASAGLEEAGHGATTRFVVSCGLILLGMERHPDVMPIDTPSQVDLLHRMDIALDYMHRAQRSTGLLDLRSTNYDSSPDTGFVVEMLCSLMLVGKDSSVLKPTFTKIESFVRRAVKGILIGGFHTPNHRWVIISALSQAQNLFDGLGAEDVIKAYVAEGFDADEEGAYIERSVVIYDEVSDRTLMIFAENWDNSEDSKAALSAVERNLEFDLNLIHADGTAETGLSRRQDYGTRHVPVGLITSLLQYNAFQHDDRHIAAAHWLWSKARPMDSRGMYWLTYMLLKNGNPPQSSAQYPTEFVRFYPKNQIWRVRQGDLSVSAFGGVTRLMTMTYGAIEMSSVKISQTYFSVGHFIAETVTSDGNSVRLHSSGVQKLHRPGYELPLNRPVPPAEWEVTFAERDYYPLPPAESELVVSAVDNGLDFHFRTLDGLDQVPVQIAFDFPAGAVWETDDTALETQAGQVIFLKKGYGRLRVGDDILTLGVGAEGHRYFAMRHAEPVPADQTRILLTFLTPVDHHFTMRLSKGLGN